MACPECGSLIKGQHLTRCTIPNLGRPINPIPPKSCTVAEAAVLHRGLQERLKGILQQYEHETGLIVTHINVNRVNKVAGPVRASDVGNIEVWAGVPA